MCIDLIGMPQKNAQYILCILTNRMVKHIIVNLKIRLNYYVYLICIFQTVIGSQTFMFRALRDSEMHLNQN